MVVRVGATRLGRLAASLEEVCGRSDTSTAGALVDGMEAGFEAFRTILRARLAASVPVDAG